MKYLTEYIEHRDSWAQLLAGYRRILDSKPIELNQNRRSPDFS